MKYFEFFLVLVVWVHTASLAPVNPSKSSEEDDEDEPIPADSLMDGPQTGLEYEKYLEQVIQVMETNPEMREKLEGMTMEDLKNGRLADEIDMLDNNIRTELDELKRLEIQRLRNIARKKMESGGARTLDTKFVDNLIGHIDPANTNAFGPQDFKKLMEKATSDLEEADRRRKVDFKKYEMEKELRRRNELKTMEERDREAAIKEWEAARETRKNHKQMKHPGSKAQLEDVWEKTDHLEKETFNPKTFFMLHDTNGDDKLDQFELEALFIKEVEELYKDSKADPKEKFEEIYRMREHVMKEIDTDKDKMVTMEEFLEATKQDDFDKDEGWEDLQQQDQYTEEELEEYREMYDEVVKEKKEKLRREQQEYLKRRQADGAGEPVVMDQERIRRVAGEAADEIIKKMEEKKLKFDPNASNNKVEDLQAAQRQQEALAQRQAAQLQQAAQQAAQQQQNEAQPGGAQPGVPPQPNQPSIQGSPGIGQAIKQAAAAAQEAVAAAQPQGGPNEGGPNAAMPNAAQLPAAQQAALAQQQVAQQAAAAAQQGQDSAQLKFAQAAQAAAAAREQAVQDGSLKQAAEQAADAVRLAMAQRQAEAAAAQQQGEGGQLPGVGEAEEVVVQQQGGEPLVPVDPGKMP